MRLDYVIVWISWSKYWSLIWRIGQILREFNTQKNAIAKNTLEKQYDQNYHDNFCVFRNKISALLHLLLVLWVMLVAVGSNWGSWMLVKSTESCKNSSDAWKWLYREKCIWQTLHFPKTCRTVVQILQGDCGICQGTRSRTFALQ